MSLKSNLGYFSRSLLYLVLLFTLIPAILLCLSPFCLFRYLISKVYALRDGASVGILPCLSAIFVKPNASSVLIQANIVLQVRVQGQLNFDHFVDRIREQLVTVQNPNLKCFVRVWLGFPFWVKEKYWSLDKHVFVVEDKGTGNTDKEHSEEFCAGFVKEYAKETLDPGRSPWEIVVVRNVVRRFGQGQGQGLGGDLDTLIVFKFNHALADGYSLFNALTKCCDQNVAPTRYQPKLPSKYQQIASICTFPVRAPFDLAKVQSFSTKTPFVPPKSEVERTFMSKSVQIPMDRIKELSRSHKASFTAVLGTILGAGIRRFLLSTSRECPEYLLMAIPFPAAAHAENLSNDFYDSLIKIPTGKIDPDHPSPFEFSQRQIMEAKKSTLHLSIRSLLTLCTCVPMAWKFKLGYKAYSPFVILFTMFPGPTRELSVLNQPITEINYLINTAGFPLGLGLFFLTYNDKIQFWASSSEGCCTSSEVDQLVSCIEFEFAHPDKSWTRAHDAC